MPRGVIIQDPTTRDKDPESAALTNLLLPAELLGLMEAARTRGYAYNAAKGRLKTAKRLMGKRSLKRKRARALT